jgi:hypothetical protein
MRLPERKWIKSAPAALLALGTLQQAVRLLDWISRGDAFVKVVHFLPRSIRFVENPLVGMLVIVVGFVWLGFLERKRVLVSELLGPNHQPIRRTRPGMLKLAFLSIAVGIVAGGCLYFALSLVSLLHSQRGSALAPPASGLSSKQSNERSREPDSTASSLQSPQKAEDTAPAKRGEASDQRGDSIGSRVRDVGAGRQTPIRQPGDRHSSPGGNPSVQRTSERTGPASNSEVSGATGPSGRSEDIGGRPVKPGAQPIDVVRQSSLFNPAGCPAEWHGSILGLTTADSFLMAHTYTDRGQEGTTVVRQENYLFDIFVEVTGPSPLSARARVADGAASTFGDTFYLPWIVIKDPGSEKKLLLLGTVCSGSYFPETRAVVLWQLTKENQIRPFMSRTWGREVVGPLTDNVLPAGTDQLLIEISLLLRDREVYVREYAIKPAQLGMNLRTR